MTETEARILSDLLLAELDTDTDTPSF